MLAVVLFHRAGLAFGFRWLHILAGVCWIGLLWYFNLVQVPSFASFGAPARNEAIEKLASRALWWFRWAAVATALTGLLITGATQDYYKDFFKRPDGLSIFTGMIIALTMFANVWLVIWPNQKIVIANASRVLQGGEPLPEAAKAGRLAGMASRQNTFFSVAMIWFMTFTSHYSGAYDVSSGGKRAVYIILMLAIVAVLELNALGVIGGTKPAAEQPLNWPFETVQNVLISAFALWFVFWILWEILFS